jgi:hypothetical protein
MPDKAWYIEQARKKYSTTSDVFIPLDPDVSKGTSPYAWVQAWVSVDEVAVTEAEPPKSVGVDWNLPDIVKRFLDDIEAGQISDEVYLRACAALQRKPAPRETMPVTRLTRVLEEFIQDINDTGGVVRTRKGHCVPVIDEDWIDLGHTYLRACAVLNKTPLKATTSEEDPHEHLGPVS